MAESDSSVADARKNCVNQVMQKRALLSKAGEPADVAVDAFSPHEERKKIILPGSTSAGSSTNLGNLVVM